MTTEELLAVLRGRGLTPKLRDGNRLIFVGKNARIEYTTQLKRVVRWHQDSIVRLLGGVPPEKPKLREWLWPDGMLVAEQDSFPSVGDESHHPGQAGWWRYQGEMKWTVINGRAERVAGIDPVAVRARAAGAESAEHLDGPVPGARRQNAQLEPVDRPGSELPESPVQGRLFGQGGADRSGAESL